MSHPAKHDGTANGDGTSVFITAITIQRHGLSTQNYLEVYGITLTNWHCASGLKFEKGTGWIVGLIGTAFLEQPRAQERQDTKEVHVVHNFLRALSFCVLLCSVFLRIKNGNFTFHIVLC